MLDRHESVHTTGLVTAKNPRKLVLGRRSLLILSFFRDNIFVGLVSGCWFWWGWRGKQLNIFQIGVKLEREMQLKDIVFWGGPLSFYGVPSPIGPM